MLVDPSFPELLEARRHANRVRTAGNSASVAAAAYHQRGAHAGASVRAWELSLPEDSTYNKCPVALLRAGHQVGAEAHRAARTWPRGCGFRS